MNKSTARSMKQQLRKAAIQFAAGYGSTGEADRQTKAAAAVSAGAKKALPRTVHSDEPEQRAAAEAANGQSHRQAALPAAAGSSSRTDAAQHNPNTAQADTRFQRNIILPIIARQQEALLARGVSSGGKLPEGFQWHISGGNAYAAKNKANKPLAVATAAGQPALFGVDPLQYVKHMQAIDSFNEAAQDSSVPKRRLARLTAGRDAALAFLGTDAEQYAGQRKLDYYQSYVNHPGNAAAAQAYQDNYGAPFFQIRGSATAKHADRMTVFRLIDRGLSYNPMDAIETGETQLLQTISEEDKNAYLSIIDKYGTGTGNDFWDTLKQDGGYNRNAYLLRDAAYRNFAREHPILSSAVSVIASPLSLIGSAYSLGQMISGQEIDPYADPFLYGQATSTIRQQVGAEITRSYGNEDGTDNLGSWLMRMGYDAAMAAGDSLVFGSAARGILPATQKGAALLGSLMQGTSGAGSVIQDIKLRGGTDEQALMMGGLFTVFETATEFLPMEKLLKTADLKDVVSFRALATNAFKGGLAEAPGEGLSEVLSGVSDYLVMGELSNYEQAWRAYRAEGMNENAAKQKAAKDALWRMLEASFTGFLSGEFSNTAAGAGNYLHSKNGVLQPGTLPSGKWQQGMPNAEVWLSPTMQDVQQSTPQEGEILAETGQEMAVDGEQISALPEQLKDIVLQAKVGMEIAAGGEQLSALPEQLRANDPQAGAGQEAAAGGEQVSALLEQQAQNGQAEVVQEAAVNGEQVAALLEQLAQNGQAEVVQEAAVNGEQVAALTEQQVADTQTEPLQRQETKVEQLVASPVQQETVQPAQALLALSPARQQAVHDSWQQAARPLYQALRPQFEAVQQIQDPTQRRMTEAALERPFYLLWQEAARRQVAPVFEGLERQSGGKASRLLAEAAAGRFYDLQWEEMKGRSAESGGMPGIALLESEVGSGAADGDTTALREVEHGRLPEKEAGGDAAEIDKPYPKAAEILDDTEKNGIIDVGELVSKRESGSKVSSDKVPSSADVDGLYRINLPRDKKKAIISRGISEKTAIFAIDNEDNHFASYVRNVPRKEGFYDVALHGSDTSVEFFGTRIDAYTLSQIVRQRKDYKLGTPIRLLSCDTGNTDNTGDCVAQIVANELGVIVEAPTEILYISPNGVITIGDTCQGEMKTFYPRK